jgi:DNA-binding CsgD family transcriptional regulator
MPTLVTHSQLQHLTPAEALRRLYGLTPAESALACELAAGCTVAEAARRLSITTGTARARLKVVFGKTGTQRQVALVRLLLLGPAQLRELEDDPSRPRDRTASA